VYVGFTTIPYTCRLLWLKFVIFPVILKVQKRQTTQIVLARGRVFFIIFIIVANILHINLCGQINASNYFKDQRRHLIRLLNNHVSTLFVEGIVVFNLMSLWWQSCYGEPLKITTKLNKDTYLRVMTIF